MAADRKDIRKKIVFAGQGLFWQTELRQVFTKEGWQTFVWEADKPASEEVIKIHNIPVLVYALDVALTGEPGIKALQDFLHVLQAGWLCLDGGSHGLSAGAAGESDCPL